MTDLQYEDVLGYGSVNSLSLYRYAKILGINPVHFSTAGDIRLADGSLIFPLSESKRFYQSESYHPSEGVSRDEINEAIADAEMLVEDFLGAFVTPKWVTAEQISLAEHYNPIVGYNTKNLRGERIEYTPRWWNFISGGRRATTLIEAGVAVTYSDPDGDGWDELATIEFEFDDSTSLYEILCFYSGYDGAAYYTIRPPLSKSRDGSTITMTFETWKMIDPGLQEAFPTNDRNNTVDLTDENNLVEIVDIYRVYNDATEDHAEFIYEACTDDLDLSRQSAYVKLVNPKVNGINIIPANYSDGEWTRSTIYGKLKYIELYYYSGFSYRPTHGANFWDDLHPELARAIAYIATARLSRPLAGKPEVTALSQKLQEDLATSERGGFRFTTNDTIENPFGTLAGEVFAWRRLKNFQRRFRKYYAT